MKIGEFQTRYDSKPEDNACDGLFHIIIEQESDCSMDGGYTFVDVTNCHGLDKEDAKQLIDELQDFINN